VCEIAIGPHRHHRRLRRQCVRLADEARRIISAGRPGIPRHFQLPQCLVGLPPAAGHDGDTVDETGIIGMVGRLAGIRGADDKGIEHPRQQLDLGHIGIDELARMDGAALDDCVAHAGHRCVDAKNRFACHDQRAVDAAHRGADDLEVLRILEPDLLQIGWRHLARLRRQSAVAQLAARRRVGHDARRRRALGRIHIPGLGGGGDEHLPSRSAHAAHDIVVPADGPAATGGAEAGMELIDDCRFDPDIFPVDVELFGNDHGQTGLDSLSHLGRPGDEGNDAVGPDADVGIERHLGLGERRGAGTARRKTHIDQQGAANDGGAQERASVEACGMAIRHAQASRRSATGKPAACLMAARIRV